MKSTKIANSTLGKVSALFFAVFFSILSFAQDADTNLKVDVTTTKTTEEWYTNPLYLIIGAVVLIILIAIIARGGGKRN